MAIRITRNDAGNCINFVGSSNPAYWNACLSAVINSEDPMRVDIINDIRSENEDETQYEFYAVNYADFKDKNGELYLKVNFIIKLFLIITSKDTREHDECKVYLKAL